MYSEDWPVASRTDLEVALDGRHPDLPRVDYTRWTAGVHVYWYFLAAVAEGCDILFLSEGVAAIDFVLVWRREWAVNKAHFIGARGLYKAVFASVVFSVVPADFDRRMFSESAINTDNRKHLLSLLFSYVLYRFAAVDGTDTVRNVVSSVVETRQPADLTVDCTPA